MDTGHGSVDQRQKKGGRECRPSTRGRMRRRCWRPIHTTLFNQPAVPWASFTNCQKKGGVFPKHPRVRRIAPSPKKQSNHDARFSDWSSPSRQNKGCGQQPKKKTGFPRRYGYKRLPVLSGADRYDSSAATRGMTETGHNTTAMEFALLALFTCSLASVIATVFRGTY